MSILRNFTEDCFHKFSFCDPLHRVVGRTSLFLTLLLLANSFQMSLFVTEMALSFFVRADRCFVGLSTSAALLDSLWNETADGSAVDPPSCSGGPC